MTKSEALMSYLRKQESGNFVSAKKLANMLGVTDRTIRSYIRKINAEDPLLIESSREGYRINLFKKTHEVSSENNSLNNRRFHVLRRLFKSRDRGTELFDLADSLYVSDATIRSDLAALSLMAKKYELKISQTASRFILTGTEKKKRDLMVDLIKEQNTQGTSFKEDIQKFLGDLNLKSVVAISRQAFKKYEFSPNTYFFQNFILHLALAIDRSRVNVVEEDGSEVISKLASGFKESTAEKVIALICDELKERFDLKLHHQDRLELTVLCYTEIKDTPQAYDDYISNGLEAILDRVLEELSSVYLLDFSDAQFRQKLIYHVQNLYNRAQENRSIRNFSLLDIKIKYPILFDIAVYMASLLSEKLQIEINEDEISFLALHIGTFIDNKTEEDKKLQTVIVTPAYLHMGKIMTSKLLENFAQEIRISSVYEDFSQISNLAEADLIVTTFGGNEIPVEFRQNEGVVMIKEFVTNSDVNKVRVKIETIYQAKYRQFLWQTLPEWISEDLYVQLTQDLDRSKILAKIMDLFLAKNYVESQFKGELEARETFSSTAFPSKIAIPHAVKYDALQTGIMVIQSTGQLDWAGKEVDLVLALAVRKSDSQVFNRIFPRIIEVVAEAYHVEYLARSNSREKFIERLIDLLTSDGYYS